MVFAFTAIRIIVQQLKYYENVFSSRVSLFAGGNWEAESGHHNTERLSSDRYFINLCHGVINSEATTKCPEGAAACRISK